jgi:serine/threonine-protein kinase Stk1
MNSSSIDSEWVGRVIDGRFPLRQWLGSSGLGGVFLTELDGDPSRKAAIKLIPADESAAQARIRVWAATETLSHPCLMRLFQTGSWRIGSTMLLYAVMECAEENLSQILPERPLTPSETREMLAPLLDALGYLHMNGFVHGHLKPSNILVVDDQLRISSESLQVAGEPARIPALPGVYDPPEGVAEPISPSADLWSLGVLLVETLTQHPPVWDKSVHQEPVVPEQVPQPFAAVARECLRVAPERRPTVQQVKTRLESPSSLPEPESETVPTAPAKHRLKAFVAALLVLLLVVTALLLRSRQNPPSTPTGGQQTSVPASTPAAKPSPKPAPAPPQPSPVARKESPAAVPLAGAVVHQVLPDVPMAARNTINGKVHVAIRVTVDPSGAVSDATIDSAGSRYFANLALEAARQWRFQPSESNEQARSRVWLLRFEFTRTGTTAGLMQ